MFGMFDEVSSHIPGFVGGGATFSVLSSLIWGYILRRREDRKDREQQTQAEISVAKEWQHYAAEIKQDFDRHRAHTDEALAIRDAAIAELKRRSDRCEQRERKLKDRVASLEQHLGIKPGHLTDDDTPTGLANGEDTVR